MAETSVNWGYSGFCISALDTTYKLPIYKNFKLLPKYSLSAQEFIG